jgi:hypothetical protein
MNFMREKIKHYCFYHLCHVFDVTLTNNLLILNISMGEIKGKMYSNKVIILNWYLLHVLSLISSMFYITIHFSETTLLNATKL